MLGRLLSRLERYLFDHRAGSRLFAPLRYVYVLLLDFLRGDLTLRAMSLVYTTLLSIVPLLALSFSVLKGLGYHRDLEPVLYQFLEPLGDKAYTITSQAMEFVDNTRGGIIGSFGFVFLLYTSISMIQKIEESFNFVWRVKEPRGIGRRISEYVSVLLIGPALIIAALSLFRTVGDHSVMHAIANIEPFGTLLLWFSKVTPYILVASVFTFLYGFVPNTKVRLRAALIGGIAAGLLWAMTGALFGSFYSSAKGTMLIYAGFAIVILALIWLYFTWLILLIGAQLAFYVQHPQSMRPGAGTLHLTPQLAERLGLSTMYLLSREHVRGVEQQRTSYTLNSLAEKLFLPSTILEPIVTRLVQSNLLVIAEDESLLPGRDLSSIHLADVLDSVRSCEDFAAKQIQSVSEADAVAKIAEDAMRASLRAKSLKDWVSEAEVTRDS